MFTGIVEEIGAVRLVTPGGLSIAAKKSLEGTKVGDSIAVNGTCLTVTTMEGDTFSVDVMPETFRRTNLGLLKVGDPMNLERSMVWGGRFGGHIVQGHVDGTMKVLSVVPEGDAHLMRFEPPQKLMQYIVEKGFLAADGVSLTVMDRDETTFRVSLVEYTWNVTNLGRRKPGDVVNLEVDIIAKYLEQLLGKKDWGISMQFLTSREFMGQVS